MDKARLEEIEKLQRDIADVYTRLGGDAAQLKQTGPSAIAVEDLTADKKDGE